MISVPARPGKNGLVISVKVRPGASRKGIDGIEGDALKVWLTAPPVEGAANEQLVDVLSEAFGIKKSGIRVIKGLSSRNKVVEVEGVKGLQLKEK